MVPLKEHPEKSIQCLTHEEIPICCGSLATACNMQDTWIARRTVGADGRSVLMMEPGECWLNAMS